MIITWQNQVIKIRLKLNQNLVPKLNPQLESVARIQNTDFMFSELIIES